MLEVVAVLSSRGVAVGGEGSRSGQPARGEYRLPAVAATAAIQRVSRGGAQIFVFTAELLGAGLWSTAQAHFLQGGAAVECPALVSQLV